MKKSTEYVGLGKVVLLCLLALFSCSEQDQFSLEPFDKILDGAEFKVHKGILTFRDQKSFDSFVQTTKDRTDDEWDKWEISNNFKSLDRIHEEVIEAEGIFLEEMNIKYKGNESITIHNVLNICG